MIEFIRTKRSYILGLAIFFVVMSLSAPTYSLFLKSESTEEFNYNTGLLDLQFIEDEQISIEKAFPMLDSEGIKQKDYNLKIKNTGSLPYLFDLKMLSSTDENVIDTRYIKFQVNDSIPRTLYQTSNIIASNIIIYPTEEISFKVKVWLDNSSPNNILGKKFNAKIVTEGTSVYKTLDQSGANHPNLNNNLIAVSYDEKNNTWIKADNSNTSSNYEWYNYNSQKWANSVNIKNSKKQIYDITGKHNIIADDFKHNDGNIIIDENYLDLNIKNYDDENISNIFRIKINDLEKNNIYIISNDNMSYYYDIKVKKFTFSIGNQTISSKEYNLEKNTWYILGYTYDGKNISFYANGSLISKENISGSINSDSSFKLGVDSTKKVISKITIGDIYLYNSILSNGEIGKNYHEEINVITNNLIAGYNEFYPMTKEEYYQNSKLGTVISNDDIARQYVWIPRFKYKVWNVTGENKIDSYDAYKTGIDIVFEQKQSKTGTIYCKDLDCYSDELFITKVTTNENGKYYTHPAFQDLEEEKLGYWVSKYEISTNSNKCNEKDQSGCVSAELNVESKYGNRVWSNNYLSNFYQAIKKIDLSGNYHMIKNTEWGAITYLSHSKYGRCQDNKCSDLSKNDTYVSGNNPKDTTTNNIYGVFDMNGSAGEFVMANYADSSNQLNLNNTHFQNIPVANNEYELYNSNKFILGDATKELSLNNNSIWYSNTPSDMNSNNTWMYRGGIANLENSNMFNYAATTDSNTQYLSTRIIIK